MKFIPKLENLFKPKDSAPENAEQAPAIEYAVGQKVWIERLDLGGEIISVIGEVVSVEPDKQDRQYDKIFVKEKYTGSKNVIAEFRHPELFKPPIRVVSRKKLNAWQARYGK